MSQADTSNGDRPTGASQVQGPYVLAGAIARPDPRKDPIRGDLAHIALAGKHFVPHYAVPQPRTVMPGGASLLTDPQDDAEELCVLMEGDSFEVLDEAGKWVWGCLSVEGPVGYIRADRLERLA
ncbi:hypothetical protein [Aurantiacibacter marinus]|uniref:hypothetical protein n=1 Tax=Aurantiacibacter marinus TaxID=874156 RepID=UPI000AF4C57D|nr:hypothetical protein [Aurantiacibacter marinus]